MNEPPLRTHAEVLREHLPLAGARVIDVGCGGGELARFLARAGARPIGVDCNEDQLDRARAFETVDDERYLFGYAEDLPLGDAGADIVVFSNSLHHVPVENQSRALREAARVLRAGGLLWIKEPVAEGSAFELMRPVDDESEVRSRAREAVARAAEGLLLEQVFEYTYLTRVRYADFEEFRDDVLLVDDRRMARFESLEDSLRSAFRRLGVHRGKGWEFDQPCRVNLLRRRAGAGA